MIMVYAMVALYAAIPAMLALAAILALYETFAEMKCPLVWMASYFIATAALIVLASKVTHS